MNNEPVAYRHLHEDCWEYYDAPTGEDCVDCEPLYTRPFIEGWKCSAPPCKCDIKNFKVCCYSSYTHPAKTLAEPSVKEITDLWLDVVNNIPANDKRPREWHFANAILRKAQEK